MAMSCWSGAGRRGRHLAGPARTPRKAGRSSPPARCWMCHVAVLAAAGLATVAVRRTVDVALFSTGGMELRQPGESRLPDRFERFQRGDAAGPAASAVHPAARLRRGGRRAGPARADAAAGGRRGRCDPHYRRCFRRRRGPHAPAGCRGRRHPRRDEGGNQAGQAGDRWPTGPCASIPVCRAIRCRRSSPSRCWAARSSAGEQATRSARR